MNNRDVFSVKQIVTFASIAFVVFVGFFVLPGKIPDGEIYIILSPHYDDAVFSLGGFISQKEPGSVIVATFFGGESVNAVRTDWDKLSGFSDSHEAAFSRTAENSRALKIFDVSGTSYMYEDLQYRKTNNDELLKIKITNDILSLLSKYNGKNVFVYGPAAFGTSEAHPDHILLNEATMKAAPLINRGNFHFFLYEDYPYIEKFIKDGGKTPLSFLKSKYPALTITEIPIKLSDIDLAKKKKGISAYPSQVLAFKLLGEKIPEVILSFNSTRCLVNFPELKSCEVVYEVK
ncbi:MAG: PIG-L family deacetylase [Candidatus Jorgensenbacteria bacterium]|nr:PIG-L family deacetylase [Candidatus Jorgensenbacteria bacterium]